MKSAYRVETDESIVAKVDEYIIKGVESQASDIHFEPTKKGLRIRFRLDGILHDFDSLASDYAQQFIARLKILSRMNTLERRVPQDGKFSRSIANNTIDFRVSTFPSFYGEKVVVRILDRTVHTIDLKDLGFEPRMLTACKTILDRHQGIFLVTGPTGSGKTTTLYAALSYLHSPEKNIVTLEDPVEYDIEGITQGQINPEIGFTFEVGIRALLRQDPDILMIGEIRDKQTAHVAIEASLTGHLIMSTLHTNDSVGALVRLVDMGIDPYLINASLVGVLAQRLVRKLCSDCKTEDSATADERSLFGIEKVFRPAGCSHCAQRGYWGRVGIFELLIISPEIRALMSAHPNKDEITTLALAQGMQTLCMDGITKIKEGFVSPAELMRVLF